MMALAFLVVEGDMIVSEFFSVNYVAIKPVMPLRQA